MEQDPPDVARRVAEGSRLLGGDEGRADAVLLLAAALGRDRAWLYAHADAMPEPAARAQFDQWLGRRADGVPVAHLLGRQEFWSLPLAVTADTLVPRPETERLVELALERIAPRSAQALLDLGTGSGAIALALARERPSARVTAVDREAGALQVARRNAARLGLERVRWLRGDWFSPVRGERYALIASNPPYLAADDPHLQSGLRHEPRQALVAGSDGLDDLRVIIAAAPPHLEDGGWLLLEHGLTQAVAVRNLLLARGFTQVQTWQDLEARDRVSGGRWDG